MDETISLLRDRLARSRVKVEKLEKALELAKTEIADTETTIRVLGGIASEPTGSSSATTHSSVSARQREILSILPTSADSALSPMVLFESFGGKTGGINVDTFRTTLWRMKDTEFRHGDAAGTVRATEGRYWLQLATAGSET